VRIGYVKDLASMFDTDALLIAGPASKLRSGRVSKMLPSRIGPLVRRLAAEAAPGELGGLATSLIGARAQRVWVATLPDQVSRHNSPSRAECVRRAVARTPLAKAKRPAVLVFVDDADHALAVCNAVGRALPELSFRSRREQAGALSVAVAEVGRGIVRIDARIRETVDATRHAARLVDTPPTDLDPAGLAREARTWLRGLSNVTVREIKGDALLRAGLGGIHAVGRCAVSAPRIVLATFVPSRKHRAHIALVGKGITYDTGGLHLKARGSMESMKSDMGGAAAVLGAFRVLAKTRAVPCKVSMVLCLAENAIGPNAYKPDDVLTLHSGKTVEINNTDAEGRLLLADGVSYAARILGAEVIVDAATLTGAQMIATGINHAAVVSDDEALEAEAVAAGRHSGDLVHPLPFAPEFYRQEFHSPIADMRNSVKNRSNAQSSCAAAFVHWHIDGTDARWLHVDLAGPAFAHERGTGFGVALLAELVQRIA
jgi:probable aminopeptidase NPEPL1